MWKSSLRRMGASLGFGWMSARAPVALQPAGSAGGCGAVRVRSALGGLGGGSEEQKARGRRAFFS